MVHLVLDCTNFPVAAFATEREALGYIQRRPSETELRIVTLQIGR